MQYTNLGRSGLKVSEVALGGWETYGINQDASAMVREIVTAVREEMPEAIGFIRASTGLTVPNCAVVRMAARYSAEIVHPVEP